MRNCQQQKEFKHYTTSVEVAKLEQRGYHEIDNYSESIMFSMAFKSNERNIYEEVLIFDNYGLIGSVGGSLGLFVGFSFFGCLATFLDVIFDRVVQWKPFENWHEACIPFLLQSNFFQKGYSR